MWPLNLWSLFRYPEETGQRQMQQVPPTSKWILPQHFRGTVAGESESEVQGLQRRSKLKRRHHLRAPLP